MNCNFDTTRIHSGYQAGDHFDSATPVIYPSVAYWLESFERGNQISEGKIPGFSYARVSNPTTGFLEKRLSAIDGAAEAVGVGSGMAAFTYTMLNLAEGGGKIIAPYDLYGGSFDSLRTLLPQFGITTTFVEDINDLQHIESLIDQDTKAIFTETVSNPNTYVADLPALSDLAHRHGIPLVVDNTLPTPYLIQPLKHGADIVFYSATKGLSGQGNAIGGLVTSGDQFNWANGKFPQFTTPEFILSEAAGGKPVSFWEAYGSLAFIKRVRMKYLRLMGAVLSPVNAYFQLMGIETISERVGKQSSSAKKIAAYLSTNPQVTRVNYQGLPGSPQADLIRRLLPKGVGGVLSFDLQGGREQVAKVINQVKLFKYLVNIGDSRSLIVDPISTTHRELTPEVRQLLGITGSTIRLSIGLEDPQDLIADLDQAIKASALPA